MRQVVRRAAGRRPPPQLRHARVARRLLPRRAVREAAEGGDDAPGPRGSVPELVRVRGGGFGSEFRAGGAGGELAGEHEERLAVGGRGAVHRRRPAEVQKVRRRGRARGEANHHERVRQLRVHAASGVRGPAPGARGPAQRPVPPAVGPDQQLQPRDGAARGEAPRVPSPRRRGRARDGGAVRIRRAALTRRGGRHGDARTPGRGDDVLVGGARAPHLRPELQRRRARAQALRHPTQANEAPAQPGGEGGPIRAHRRRRGRDGEDGGSGGRRRRRRRAGGRRVREGGSSAARTRVRGGVERGRVRVSLR